MNDPMRILIVEDDAIIGESIHMDLINLRHAPYPPVDNEAEAKAVMATQEVDLAFLDIRFQDGESGIELAKHIDGTNLCPYIFLTAYTDDGTLVEGEVLAAVGFESLYEVPDHSFIIKSSNLHWLKSLPIFSSVLIVC